MPRPVSKNRKYQPAGGAGGQVRGSPNCRIHPLGKTNVCIKFYDFLFYVFFCGFDLLILQSACFMQPVCLYNFPKAEFVLKQSVAVVTLQSIKEELIVWDKNSNIAIDQC